MYYGINFSSSPQCIMFGRFKQEHGWNHSGKTTKNAMLIFILSGNATFEFSGKVYHMVPGNWLLIPKRIFYNANTPSFCEYYFFHFDAICEISNTIPQTDLALSPLSMYQPASLTSKTIYLTERIDSGDNLSNLLFLSREMHQLLLRTTIGERLLFDQYFGQIILLLSLQLSNHIHRDIPQLLKKAIVHIQNNYTQPLSLTSISTEFHVSNSYMLRLFRKHLGTTVTTYINQVKLNYAAQLLQTNEMNVTQIANYLGYSDSGYFSRLFRKQFGITPSKYAQNE